MNLDCSEKLSKFSYVLALLSLSVNDGQRIFDDRFLTASLESPAVRGWEEVNVSE